MEIILIFSFNSWKEKKQLNFGKFTEMDTRVYEPISETAIDVCAEDQKAIRWSLCYTAQHKQHK